MDSEILKRLVLQLVNPIRPLVVGDIPYFTPEDARIIRDSIVDRPSVQAMGAV